MTTLQCPNKCLERNHLSNGHRMKPERGFPWGRKRKGQSETLFEIQFLSSSDSQFPEGCRQIIEKGKKNEKGVENIHVLRLYRIPNINSIDQSMNNHSLFPVSRIWISSIDFFKNRKKCLFFYLFLLNSASIERWTHSTITPSSGHKRNIKDKMNG